MKEDDARGKMPLISFLSCFYLDAWDEASRRERSQKIGAQIHDG